MEIKALYKYTRPDGGITVSVNKPDVEYIEMYRLIADENKAVTLDGENLYPCVDVTSVDGWYECDNKE